MPTPFELLRVADLVKLAAETAAQCSKISGGDDMDRIEAVCRRIKANAEELQALGLKMDRKAQERDS